MAEVPFPCLLVEFTFLSIMHTFLAAPCIARPGTGPSLHSMYVQCIHLLVSRAKVQTFLSARTLVVHTVANVYVGVNVTD